MLFLTLIFPWQAHDSSVRTMVWSHNDQWMVTGDTGGFVKYWQTNMNNVKHFQAHKDPVRGLRYNPPSRPPHHPSSSHHCHCLKVGRWWWCCRLCFDDTRLSFFRHLRPNCCLEEKSWQSFCSLLCLHLHSRLYGCGRYPFSGSRFGSSCLVVSCHNHEQHTGSLSCFQYSVPLCLITCSLANHHQSFSLTLSICCHGGNYLSQWHLVHILNYCYIPHNKKYCHRSLHRHVVPLYSILQYSCGCCVFSFHHYLPYLKKFNTSLTFFTTKSKKICLLYHVSFVIVMVLLSMNYFLLHAFLIHLALYFGKYLFLVFLLCICYHN